jgi:hypothetical protein
VKKESKMVCTQHKVQIGLVLVVMLGALALYDNGSSYLDDATFGNSVTGFQVATNGVKEINNNEMRAVHGPNQRTVYSLNGKQYDIRTGTITDTRAVRFTINGVQSPPLTILPENNVYILEDGAALVVREIRIAANFRQVEFTLTRNAKVDLNVSIKPQILISPSKDGSSFGTQYQIEGLEIRADGTERFTIEVSVANNGSVAVENANVHVRQSLATQNEIWDYISTEEHRKVLREGSVFPDIPGLDEEVILAKRIPLLVPGQVEKFSVTISLKEKLEGKNFRTHNIFHVVADTGNEIDETHETNNARLTYVTRTHPQTRVWSIKEEGYVDSPLVREAQRWRYESKQYSTWVSKGRSLMGPAGVRMGLQCLGYTVDEQGDIVAAADFGFVESPNVLVWSNSEQKWYPHSQMYSKYQDDPVFAEEVTRYGVWLWVDPSGFQQLQNCQGFPLLTEADEELVKGRELQKGFNFISVTPSMIGKTVQDIKGTCEIVSQLTFADAIDDTSYVGIPLGTAYSNQMLGYGLWIATTDDCRLAS